MWWAAPAVSQAAAEVAKSGLGDQRARADRQVGQRLFKVHDVDGVGHEAEAVAHVGEGDDDAGAGVGVEHHADWVFLAADPAAGGSPPAACRRPGTGRPPAVAHRASSRGPGPGGRCSLHDQAPPGSPAAATLAAQTRMAGLPVALRAEAVAVSHQPLRGEPGSLAQGAEVLEDRGASGGGTRWLLRKLRRPSSIRAAEAQRLVAGTAALSSAADPGAGARSRRHQGVDVGMPRRRAPAPRSLARRPRRPPRRQAQLRFGLVFLRLRLCCACCRRNGSA